MASLTSNDLTLTIRAVGDVKDLDVVSKKVGDLGDEAGKSSKVLDVLGGAASKVASLAKTAFIAAGAAASGFGVLAAKASWDQVDAVQQATVAIGAYERNTAKVNDVLAQLIAYARSDLGILFNRKDLFEAAQGLKTMGDNTDHLTDHVKIMSRSVGLGLSGWDDLSQIVGRIGSTSQLTGDDFDNLTKAGYKLDPALRNTKITFDQLFKAMDKGIPADALAGQANTIQGLGIRLQSAFRGIGDAILGVDSNTSKFIEGGLGDRLIEGMGILTQLLKDAKPAVNDLATFFRILFDTLSGADPTLQESEGKFVSLVTWLLATRDAIVSYLQPKFEDLIKVIKTDLLPVLGQLVDDFLKPLATAAGIILVVAFGLLIDTLKILAQWFSDSYNTIKQGWGRLKETLQPGIDYFMTYVWPSLQRFVDWVKKEFDQAIGIIKQQWDDFTQSMKDAGINIDGVQLGLGLLLGIVLILMSPILIVLGIIVALALAFAELVKFIKFCGDKLAEFAWNAALFIGGVKKNWDDFWGTVQRIWDAMSHMDWGKVLSGAVRSVGNSLVGMIEGAINGALRGLPGSPKVALPRFARGTNYAPGGLALVGEEGPELVSLPRGSKVQTASQTRQALSQGRSNANIYVTNNNYTQLDYDRGIAELGFRLRAA